MTAKNILVSDDESKINFKRLEQSLHDLRFEVSAQLIVLADAAGQLLLASGSIDDFDSTLLLPLINRSLSPASEVAQHLNEERGLNLVYHEGARFDVYATDIQSNLYLVLAFDRQQGLSRVGMVWLYMKRAVQELQSLIAAQM